MAPKILIVDDNVELLNLLIRVFEDAGYAVAGAGRGRQALDMARADPPRVAIIDVLLPDMMGYHLADSLRKDQRELPLIFITGVFKGGKHAIEARQKYAAGYFEKPFEAQKLIEAVSKFVTPGPKPEPNSEDSFDVELEFDVEAEEGDVSPSMELEGTVRVSGNNVSAEVRGQPLTAKSIAKGEAAVVRPAPARPAEQKGGNTPRRGELKDNLPSLITAFYLAKESGELGIQRGKVKKVVYFEKGQPVFALSNLVADRFGQFLMRVGKITNDELKRATSLAAAQKRRTGDVLVEQGLLKDTERLYYVAQQIKAIIYSLFGWEDGSFVMNFGERASAESIKLDIHPANLILRAVKKIYRPERLQRLIRPEDKYIPSLQPAYLLHEIELEKWEAELLPKVDGTRSIADLAAMSGRDPNMIRGLICGLSSLTILELRR